VDGAFAAGWAASGDAAEEPMNTSMTVGTRAQRIVSPPTQVIPS
jgi:hypothetical protein